MGFSRAEYRIMDANLNRLAEGLRTIEDCCRFQFNDQQWSTQLKAMRHQVRAIREGYAQALLDARDAMGDVGRDKIQESPTHETMLSLIGAAFGRSRESLRVLEELCKLNGGIAAPSVKQMRYAIYDLEKALLPLLDRQSKLRAMQGLYLILTDPAVGYEKLAEIAVAEKIGVLQLRAKHLDSGPLLELALRIRAITAGTDTLFIVNDRADIAALAGADGLHVGQSDLSVADARKIIGGDIIIGKSTHNPAQLQQALAEAPDYVAVGPLFSTKTKANPDSTLGLELAGEMLALSTLPTVVIGGIDSTNLSGVLDGGFKAYALIGEVGQSDQPEEVIHRLKAIEQQHHRCEVEAR